MTQTLFDFFFNAYNLSRQQIIFKKKVTFFDLFFFFSFFSFFSFQKQLNYTGDSTNYITNFFTTADVVSSY